MITLVNLLEVNILFLTWQAQNGRGRRLVVGKIVKDKFNHCNFSYTLDTDDYNSAVTAGFTGFPAFKIQNDPHLNVLETFMKRLPPRNRNDFKKYLISHFLPENFSGDDFSLLAHTSAKLPSDGFTLIPDLSEPILPFDYVMEVAGTRYHTDHIDLEKLHIGCAVDIVLENSNNQDPNAIALYSLGKKIGYVNRLLCSCFRQLEANHQLKAEILKIIPDNDRPLIYTIIRASNKDK